MGGRGSSGVVKPDNFSVETSGRDGLDTAFFEKDRFVDRSKYATQHKEVVDYIQRMTNIDVNQYRDGDGSNPNMTTYWDKDGIKVAVDWKRMPRNVKNAILSLPSVTVEQGGAWIAYIKKKK